jgi:hypothetical protein
MKIQQRDGDLVLATFGVAPSGYSTIWLRSGK